MTDKDNIKLKTDTLSSRKSSSSTGVHVKRKRKIITNSVPSKKITSKEEKKESLDVAVSSKNNATNETTSTKKVKHTDQPTQDTKSPKKQKIDKDEKIEKILFT